MPMRTKWSLCVAVPLLLALLVAVFWFSWGAYLRERYEAEVARLEAAGEPTTWEALSAVDGPPQALTAQRVAFVESVHAWAHGAEGNLATSAHPIELPERGLETGKLAAPWYARPLFWRRAVETLEGFTREIEAGRSTASARRSPN